MMAYGGSIERGIRFVGDEREPSAAYAATESRNSAGRFGTCTRKGCGFHAVDQDGLCRVCAAEANLLQQSLQLVASNDEQDGRDAAQVILDMTTRAEPVRTKARPKRTKTPEERAAFNARKRQEYAERKGAGK